MLEGNGGVGNNENHDDRAGHGDSLMTGRTAPRSHDFFWCATARGKGARNVDPIGGRDCAMISSFVQK
jgi:hypothetical protein